MDDRRRLPTVRAHMSRALRLMGVSLATPGFQDAVLTLVWLAGEHAYQASKFDFTDNDHKTRDEGIGEGTYWDQQLTNYYKRAQVLGLDTDGGRQAVMKFVATACGLAESMMRVYGQPPKPGVSSGNT